MTRKIINVKPIKEKQELKNFVGELRKTKHSERDVLIFVIGIYTGLRISDILNLKVVDVKNKVETNIVEIKTNKRRILNLRNVTNQIIIYLEQEHDGESEWLFPSPRDNCRPLATHQYYKIMQKVADNLGLDYVGTHSMRKTFGYMFYQQYKDLPTLMRILNHSSQQITLRYIGIEDEEIKNSLDNFNPLS